MRLNTHTLRTLSALAVGLAFGIAAAHANEADDVSMGKSLVKKHACFTCHAVSGTKIGPGFSDVAATFAGKPDAAKTLTDAIVHGVQGTAMPANSELSDAEVDQIVDWIRSLKK